MNWTSPTTAVSTVVQGVRGDAGRFGELCRGGGGGGEAEDVTAAARPGVGQDPEGGGLASAGGGDHQLQLAPVGGQGPHHRGLPGVQRRAAGCCLAEPEVDRGRSGLLPWRPLLHAVRAQLAADRELPAGCWRPSFPRSHGPRRRRPSSPGWTAARSPSVTIQRKRSWREAASPLVRAWTTAARAPALFG
jgi:hypothetical protein